MLANESLDRQSSNNKLSERDTTELKSLLYAGLIDTFRIT